MGTPVVDLATGLYSAIAILMALHERKTSGLGQYLDMTLHDCGMALLHPQAANFFLNGRRPVATGNPHPNIAPYEKYRTKTCEIFIAAGNDGQFRRLCEALGRPEIGTDARFLTNADRVKHRTEMAALLGEAFAEQDGHVLTRRLLDLGLPAGPVLAVDEALNAEHTEARAMVTEMDGYRGLGTPIKFSRTPGGTRRPPPRFAEHAEEVLAGCGYSDEEIAVLREAGIVHSTRKK
jgi:formyl-CoA transferase